MSAEIKQATGIDSDLIPGGNGIFDIKRDEELIFSKYRLGRFPEEGEIAALL